MSNTNISKPNIKFKKLRNKDSYMNAFLERRRKAADFALTDKNKVYYKYEIPYYILKNEEEIMELKRKSKNQMNSVRNKSEFYKTYRTLKYSITHKNSNNSLSNKVIIEKENNKYYLSQELLEEKKDKKYFDKYLDKLDNNMEIDKKYNNIKHHTINVSSKIKKNKNNIDNKQRRNSSWKNLQIQKTTSINNYEFLENNKKKKEKEIDKSPLPFLAISNEYEYNINNNHRDNKNTKSITRENENDINKIIEKYKNTNIDYEETNIKKYYESSPKNKETQQNYQYNTNKPKNLNEPQNLFEKTKNVYSLKGTKSNNNIRNTNNKYHFNYKSKINEISPIKTYFHYDIKELNDDTKNLEKIIESQTLNSNGNSKSDTNNNIKSNLNLVKANYKQNENQDLNSGYYKDEKSSSLHNYNHKINNNSEKLKNVGILYKNKKYYIDNNLNNLEIPMIVENDKNKIQQNININTDNIENNNNDEAIKEDDYMEIKSKGENKYPEMNNDENDIQKLNNSFKNSKEKENNLVLEKYFNSLENKSQQINNTNNNNFNLTKPKENNNKIKNIKAQSYKKFSEGHNFESMKEKYESFLKPKEEKEPNIQSKVVNSLLSSKEDLNNNNNTNNNLGNHNKSLVRNIQEKIKILKSNKSQNNAREYNNYINEIDECYTKIKLKEEKDNLTLKKYYEELIQKENNEIEKEENIKIKGIKRKKGNEKENMKLNDNKKNIIQKSKRLEYIMRNLINNKRYNHFDYHFLSNKMNKIKAKNKENSDINNIQFLGNSAPDINLIVDQSMEENKIIDENEFEKLRNKNVRSARTINKNAIKDDENKKNKHYRRNSDILSNYYNYVSPRLIIKDINHKIMPPNELN